MWHACANAVLAWFECECVHCKNSEFLSPSQVVLSCCMTSRCSTYISWSNRGSTLRTAHWSIVTTAYTPSVWLCNSTAFTHRWVGGWVESVGGTLLPVQVVVGGVNGWGLVQSVVGGVSTHLPKYMTLYGHQKWV